MTIRKFLPVAFVFLSCFAFAQESSSKLDSISVQLVSSIRLQQTEQSFIVTDKSLYKSGESVWLRIFLLRSASQRLSTMSRNLFIDLVNESDSVFATLLLDARTGMLSAKLYLEQSMPSGFYWIRAYTRYMADVEKNKIAIQPIYVVNSTAISDNGSRVVRKGSYDPDNISMQLFPEGGSLMTGANCTVAFHIVDGKKDPVAITGSIKDNRDSLVTSFTSDNYGLGKFEFFPTRGRQYEAHLIWNGKEMTYPLPPFNFFAGQISIINQGNGRKIRVLLEDSVYRNDVKTYLVGITKDSLCFASIGTAMYEVPIPAERFPGGVTTFYLFDENLRLLSERSVYFKDNLVVKASLNKNVYKRREKADLTLSISDAAGHPLPASLSIAVVDTSLIQPTNTSTIVSNYFDNNDQLSSENWSLANAGDLTEQQLDVLMMARNNSYRDIMFRTRPAFYSDSDSLLYIQGNALYNKEKPAANKIATIFSKTTNAAYDIDTTSNAGRFVFPIAQYPDSTRFMIQVSTPQGAVERADIILDKFNFPKVRTVLPKEKFTVKPATVNHYLKVYPDTLSVHAGELSAVTVRGYKKKELSYDPSKRVSQDSKIITSENIGQGSNSVTNAFLRVPGVQVVNGFVAIRGISSFSPGPSTEPMLVLDGIQVFPASAGLSASPVLNYLDQLNPDDISFIEVLTGPEGSAYGVRGGNGVVLINTRKLVDAPGGTSLNTFVVRGYHTPPAFMMPDYGNSKVKSAKFNDIRPTLYWEPEGLTDANGQMKLAFFTSDVATNYKVIITGITSRGDVINQAISFRTE